MGFTPAAIASLAITAIGTGVSMYGQIQQGKNQQAQANYQAAIMERNAKIAEMNANDAERRGAVEEQQLRLRTSSMIGEARSDLSASGVVVDSGSPLEAQQEIAAMGAYDVNTQRYNAAKEAWSIRNQAADYTAQSRLYSMAGANAASEGRMGAFGTALTGLGSMADKWYKYSSGKTTK